MQAARNAPDAGLHHRPVRLSEKETPMANEFTTRAIDADMGQLNALIAQMGGLAESQIVAAIDALHRGDHDKASDVVARDKQLDRIEAEVEKLAIQLIALRA